MTDEFYHRAYRRAPNPRPTPTIQTEQTRTAMTLTLAQLQDRVAQIITDWDLKDDDEKAHAEIDKLQRELLETLADPPPYYSIGDFRAMARLVLTLEELDFERWSA